MHAAFWHEITRVVVDVYGSLLTGKGHHTDIAIIMGLAGNLPDTVDIDAIPGFIQDVNTHGRLLLANGEHEVEFPVDHCMNFHADNLSLHENGMRITALAGDKVRFTARRITPSAAGLSSTRTILVKHQFFAVDVPYPYKNAADLQRHCQETGLSLSGLMMKNELALHSKEELEQHFANVWEVMRSGIERGITTEGVLPGKLRVPRRAAALRRMLVSTDKTTTDPMAVVDWINMFALAVNEENAAGGRVVTAPTNGACGIVPAVLAYYDKFIREVNANSLARLPADRQCDWLTVQDERLDFRRGSGLSGVKWASPALWRRRVWPNYWAQVLRRFVLRRKSAWNITWG